MLLLYFSFDRPVVIKRIRSWRFDVRVVDPKPSTAGQLPPSRQPFVGRDAFDSLIKEVKRQKQKILSKKMFTYSYSHVNHFRLGSVTRSSLDRCRSGHNSRWAASNTKPNDCYQMPNIQKKTNQIICFVMINNSCSRWIYLERMLAD